MRDEPNMDNSSIDVDVDVDADVDVDVDDIDGDACTDRGFCPGKGRNTCAYILYFDYEAKY